MFFKSYKAKPTTAVKNSDKKKLWSRLSSQTNVKDTGLKEDKSAVVTVCKLSTHHRVRKEEFLRLRSHDIA